MRNQEGYRQHSTYGTVHSTAGDSPETQRSFTLTATSTDYSRMRYKVCVALVQPDRVCEFAYGNNVYKRGWSTKEKVTAHVLAFQLRCSASNTQPRFSSGFAQHLFKLYFNSASSCYMNYIGAH